MFTFMGRMRLFITTHFKVSTQYQLQKRIMKILYTYINNIKEKRIISSQRIGIPYCIMIFYNVGILALKAAHNTLAIYNYIVPG